MNPISFFTFRSMSRKVKHKSVNLIPGSYTLNISLGGIDFKYKTDKRDAFFKAAIGTRLRKFESETIPKWIQHCKNGGVAIDVGAYSGIYSLLAGKCGASMVYTYEPIINLLPKIIENLAINDLSKIVTVRDSAVGDKCGVSDHFIPRVFFKKSAHLFSTGSRVVVKKEAEENSSFQSYSKVGMVALDCDLPPTYQSQVKCIKIDVEGFELKVLEGCRKIITKSNPALILESHTEETKRAITNFLRAYGYSTPQNLSHNLYFTPRSEVEL